MMEAKIKTHVSSCLKLLMSIWAEGYDHLRSRREDEAAIDYPTLAKN